MKYIKWAIGAETQFEYDATLKLLTTVADPCAMYNIVDRKLRFMKPKEIQTFIEYVENLKQKCVRCRNKCEELKNQECPSFKLMKCIDRDIDMAKKHLASLK